MYNSRRITQQFHDNNTLKYKLIAFTNSMDFNYLQQNTDKDTEYKKLSPGVYSVFIKYRQYLFILHDTLIGDDKIIIRNNASGYSIINNKKKNIHLYMVGNFSYKKLNHSKDNLNPSKYANSKNAMLPFKLQTKLTTEDYDDYDINLIKINNFDNSIVPFKVQSRLSTENYYEFINALLPTIEQTNNYLPAKLQANIISSDENSALVPQYSVINNALPFKLQTRLSSEMYYPVQTAHGTIEEHSATPDNGLLKMNFTVNDYLDGIIINGNTELEYKDGTNIQSPYHPANINSISKFEVFTSNKNNAKINKLEINIKNNIKKLPSGVSDLFVIDSYNQKAFILYRIGRLIITGNESWELVEKRENYSIYFMPYDNVSTGEDDTSIICNYMISSSNTRLLSNEFNSTYSISNSNDESKCGFYIRFPNDLLNNDPSIDNLKDYFRKIFKNKPMIIEYLLKDFKYKTILLEEYHIKSFNGYTNISVDYSTNITCLNKALYYIDES